MAITLTDRAVEEIRTIRERNELADSTALRVGVKSGGCGGFTYVLDMCDGPNEGDEVFTSEGVQIVVDPKSLLYLDGTEIDYTDKALQRGFVFNNPNAAGACGCGSSFSA